MLFTDNKYIITRYIMLNTVPIKKKSIVPPSIPKLSEKQQLDSVVRSIKSPNINVFDSTMQVTPALVHRGGDDNIKPLYVEKGIYVGHNKDNGKYYIRDESGQNIGEMSINNIIKYLGSIHDEGKQFMINIPEDQQKMAEVTFKRLVGDVKLDEDKYALISIHDYTGSPFMSDVQLVMQLNKEIIDFDKNKLDDALRVVDKKIIPKIRGIIKKFIYTMLNYTLQLIEKVGDEQENTKELINYSVSTVYHISQYVQQQLKDSMDKVSKLNKAVDNSNKLRKIVESKIDNLALSIKKVQPTQSGGRRKKSYYFSESEESDAYSGTSTDSDVAYDI